MWICDVELGTTLVVFDKETDIPHQFSAHFANEELLRRSMSRGSTPRAIWMPSNGASAPLLVVADGDRLNALRIKRQ